MATRSRIGIKIGPRKYLSIYCHWDGYPSHNGKLLRECYSTKEQVMKLMELGDLSLLQRSIPDCDSYGRDWEQTGVSYKTHTSEADLIVEDYSYLFKNNKWYYCFKYDDNPKFRLLTDKIIRER